MTFRRINIVRNENLADREQLQHHPNVRSYVQFPWGYTLFEFYDPIFDKIDPGSPGPSTQSEETRRHLAALMLEERRLLWPIYKGRPPRWQGNQLGLFLETGIYRVLGKKKTDWPWFGSSPGWESKTKIKIIGRVRSPRPDTRAVLHNMFKQWVDWATATSTLVKAEPLIEHGGMFSTLCTFKDSCCEACIGLYLLLAETKKQTLLEAVGFFVPEDASPRFFEIGGNGVIG